jgi:hypothetical protein
MFQCHEMYRSSIRFSRLVWKTARGKQLTLAGLVTNLIGMPMVDQHIRIGQVWKKVGTEETFLVTKLYNEALSTIAVLRPTGAATESMVRVRVERRGDGQILPGYSMAQESEGN